MWDVPGCEAVRTLRGHNAQVGCIEFHPQATLTQDPAGICIASCAHDGSVKLWNLENEEPIADIEGGREGRGYGFGRRKEMGG